jgi:ubiquinone biosynthesis protein UbiJ
MAEYRTPLPGILAAMLETAINRLLELDENSPEHLERLEGRMLQLDMEGLGITLYFAFNGRRMEVGTTSEYEPDTVISGSPAALFSMAVPEGVGHWGTAGSRVNISGDANLARDLERLFSRLDPDWEGRLSRLFGEVWGHQVAAGLRAGARQARTSAGQAGEMIEEYLQRPGGALVLTEEFSEFSDSVDAICAETERLEARLSRLEQRGGPAPEEGDEEP